MKSRFCIVFLVFTILLPDLYAQTRQKIDSLQKILRTVKKDAHGASVLCSLCGEMTEFNVDSALRYGKTGLEIATNAGATKSVGVCNRALGVAYGYDGNFNDGFRYLQSALKIAEDANDTYEIALALQEIGVLYHENKADYKTALGYYQKSLALIEKIKARGSLAKLRRLMGATYYSMENYVAALENYQQGLDLAEKAGRIDEIAKILANFGDLYAALEEYPKSRSFVLRSMALHRRTGNRYEVTLALNVLGVSYARENKLDSAIFYYKQARDYFSTTNDGDNEAILLMNIANAYVKLHDDKTALSHYKQAENLLQNGKQKEYLARLYNNIADINLRTQNIAAAVEYIQKALPLAQETSSKNDLKTGYKIFAKIDSARGDFRAAFEHHKLYSDYRDSVYNNEKSKQKSQIETKYETEKKEKQIKDLEKEEVVYGIIFAIVSVAGCTIIGLLWMGFRNKRRANEILIVKNNIITAKNAEISQQKEEIEAQSEQINLQLSDLQAKNAEIMQQNEEIEAQSEQINFQLTQLRELGDFKDAMTAMIIHDLKNPLSSIISIVEKDYSPRNQAMIRQAGKQMLNLTLNILDVQKFESADVQLHLSDVKMTDVAKTAVEQVQLLIGNKKQRLISHIPANFVVHIDNELIDRVIVNLLTNAIKYTPNNGTITLQAEEAKDGWIKFSVSDTGQGIPADKIYLVFEKFGQIDAKHSGAARSTGLGLTYCKMVVEAHGGMIDLVSAYGSGTTFFFTLPRSKDILIPEGGATEEGPVLAYAQEPALELSKEDREYLRPFVEKMQIFEVYEITDIQHILHEMVPVSKPIAQWMENVEDSVHFCNEEEYKKLLNTSKK